VEIWPAEEIIILISDYMEYGRIYLRSIIFSSNQEEGYEEIYED